MRPSPSKSALASENAVPTSNSPAAVRSPVGRRQIPPTSQPQPLGHAAWPRVVREQSKWHSPTEPRGRQAAPPSASKVSQSSGGSTTPLPHSPLPILGKRVQLANSPPSNSSA